MFNSRFKIQNPLRPRGSIKQKKVSECSESKWFLNQSYFSLKRVGVDIIKYLYLTKLVVEELEWGNEKIKIILLG